MVGVMVGVAAPHVSATGWLAGYDVLPNGIAAQVPPATGGSEPGWQPVVHVANIPVPVNRPLAPHITDAPTGVIVGIAAPHVRVAVLPVGYVPGGLPNGTADQVAPK